MKLHLETENGVVDTVVAEVGMRTKVTKELTIENDENKPCAYNCEHTCTLVGHAYEAMRFLNQCMDHGIVKSAVEGDPEYQKLLDAVKEFRELHRNRNPAEY